MLGLQSTQRRAREQHIARIRLQRRGRDGRTHLVRGTVKDERVELFDRPAVVHKPHRKPIKQLRVRRPFAEQAEIIRGGIESVPRTQIEAAETMNISRLQTTLTIILPQAWPVIIPPAIAFGVSFIKDTALVSQIGVFELTFRGKELNNQGFSGILVFGTIAMCYFLLSFPLSMLGQYLEKRLATPLSQRSTRKIRHS